MDRDFERDQDRPKPHGDPLRGEIVEDRESPDREEPPVGDDEKRRKQYDEGADLVSGID